MFLVLIAGGGFALMGRSSEEVTESLTPFLGGGWSGLVAAMGFTFIALQGFDLIAAVAECVVPGDLLILGVQRLAKRKRAFGRFTLAVARVTDCPILMISRRV